MRGTAAVVVGGLVAGALDIAFACIFWWLEAGSSPTRIFQSVAAGLLGKDSFTGGAATAALGLALHMAIAMTFAFAYRGAAQVWPALARYPLRCGALYGLAVYGVMRYAVIPLSATSAGGADNRLWITLMIAAHVVLIGIPIALATSRAVGTR
jgi:uncharacterized membrane protein YagU involved in acid resistance